MLGVGCLRVRGVAPRLRLSLSWLEGLGLDKESTPRIKVDM